MKIIFLLLIYFALSATVIAAGDSDRKGDSDMIKDAKDTIKEIEDKSEPPKSGNNATKIEAPKKKPNEHN